MKIDYIGTNYVNKNDFVVNHPDGLEQYLLMLFLTEVTIRTAQSEIMYPSGTMILYAPHVPQYYCNKQTGFSNDWIQFLGAETEEFLTALDFPLNTPFRIQDPELLHQRFQTIEDEFFMKYSYHNTMETILLKELLIHIRRELLREGSPCSTELELRFRSANSQILSSLDQNWTLENMAALVGLSPSRFSHIYRSIFHISPKKNLILERMYKAKFLIQSQNYSVSEAASMVGYDNIFQFSKQFKRITGKAPSDYRK